MGTLRELVESFCVRKLAQILYDCVECSYSDRAELDWCIAENFIRRCHGHVDRIVQIFIAKSAQDKISGATIVSDDMSLSVRFNYDYETFDRLCGGAVWNEIFQMFKSMLPRPLYTRIRFE